MIKWHIKSSNAQLYKVKCSIIILFLSSAPTHICSHGKSCTTFTAGTARNAFCHNIIFVLDKQVAQTRKYTTILSTKFHNQNPKLLHLLEDADPGTHWGTSMPTTLVVNDPYYQFSNACTATASRLMLVTETYSAQRRHSSRLCTSYHMSWFGAYSSIGMV